MRKIFVAFLGAVFGLMAFVVQVKAQHPAQMPVVCGMYDALAQELKKQGEAVIGRGTDKDGDVVEFWMDMSKGEGSVVLKLDIDKACLVLKVEGFTRVIPGKDA